MALHVIVLAAGEGKRMKSSLPKVAHPVAGRSIIEWVFASLSEVDPASTVVVLGHGADQVRPLLSDGMIEVFQEQQLGTGHATQVALDVIAGSVQPDDTVLILNGDMPLVDRLTVLSLAELAPDVGGSILTAVFVDPTGYGRVVRDETGSVVAIVEHRDCTPEELEIAEINAGVYTFKAGSLIDALDQVSSNNSQGEFYLTDVVGILVEGQRRIVAVTAPEQEVVGINSQDQLSEAARLIFQRTNQRLMESGVTMVDPSRVYVEESVVVEPGAKIYPGVHLEGDTTVRSGAQVGPDVFVVDSSIGPDSRVWYAVVRSSQIGSGCEVGPYASLRPGSVLKDGSKVGTFVEVKNSTLGEGAKAGHLTYLGDATIGARSNIGAGTVTVNYDGYEKHHTEIGEDVFIGSDTMLVAPVEVGDRAMTGAGSVITRDVAEDALAVERSEQREIAGYSERRARKHQAKKENS